VFYDFNEPENVPTNMMGTFDMVVIDPPFITREVWEKYTTTAKILQKAGVDAEGDNFVLIAQLGIALHV
jgi:16S rRNA G966 N2-methylase RsmD